MREFLYYDQRNIEVMKKRASSKKKLFQKNIKDLINVSHCHCVCGISKFSIFPQKSYNVQKKNILFCEHLSPTEDAERSPMCVNQLARDYLYDELWFS